MTNPTPNYHSRSLSRPCHHQLSGQLSGKPDRASQSPSAYHQLAVGSVGVHTRSGNSVHKVRWREGPTEGTLTTRGYVSTPAHHQRAGILDSCTGRPLSSQASKPDARIKETPRLTPMRHPPRAHARARMIRYIQSIDSTRDDIILDAPSTPLHPPPGDKPCCGPNKRVA